MRVIINTVIGLVFLLTLAHCGGEGSSSPVGEPDVVVDVADVAVETAVAKDLAAPQDKAGEDKYVGPCYPWCGNKVCGDDGCGGSCGQCQAAQVCLLQGTCAPAPTQPAPGSLVITEIMADPYKVPDTDGEWFEIRNVTDKQVGLSQLVIRDLGQEYLLMEDVLILEPGAYFVFGRKGNPENNGGASVHYEWSGFQLSNDADQIILEFKGVEIDRVEWFEPMWNMPIGASLSLPPDKHNSADNNVFGHWCTAKTSMAGAGTDLGTPGSGNPECGGCNPNCAGVQCGTDGCGGTCGECATGLSCQGGKCVQSTGDVPDVGEVIVNEIMSDPDAVNDSDGEWVELHNTTSKTLVLTGLVVKDAGADKFAIDTDLAVAGNGFVVLGRKADTAVNGGVKVDFAYGSSFSLANKDDEVILEYAGILIDSVVYNADNGWPDSSGAALSLDPLSANWELNDKPEAWCPATEQMTGGDKGTPGESNPACK